MILFICTISPNIGLGHLSRMIAVSQSLKKLGTNEIKFCILGEKLIRSDLDNVEYKFISHFEDFGKALLLEIIAEVPEVIIFDLHSTFINSDFEFLLDELLKLNIFKVGVDNLIPYVENLDLVWIPSFYKPAALRYHLPETVIYGWDSYLIQKRLPEFVWGNGNRIMVLTGGSDFAGLGKILPKILDEIIPDSYQINWVKGPFAAEPDIPETSCLEWIIHKDVVSLDSLIVKCNYALTVFGVSLFELLQYGIPTVVFSPYGTKDIEELDALKKENVALVSSDYNTAVTDLTYLMSNTELADRLSVNAVSKMAVNGADKMAEIILSRTRNK